MAVKLKQNYIVKQFQFKIKIRFFSWQSIFEERFEIILPKTELTTHSIWGFSEVLDEEGCCGWGWLEQSTKLAALLPSLTDPFPGVVGVWGGLVSVLGSDCIGGGAWWSCGGGGIVADGAWGKVWWWGGVVTGSIAGWARGAKLLTSSDEWWDEWSCQLLTTIAIVFSRFSAIEKNLINRRQIEAQIVGRLQVKLCKKSRGVPDAHQKIILACEVYLDCNAIFIRVLKWKTFDFKMLLALSNDNVKDQTFSLKILYRIFLIKLKILIKYKPRFILMF